MLINKDENISNSVVHIGYHILRLFKSRKQLTIFEVAKELKSKKITSYRQLVFSLMFLHSIGLIEFNSPYIQLVNDEN